MKDNKGTIRVLIYFPKVEIDTLLKARIPIQWIFFIAIVLTTYLR